MCKVFVQVRKRISHGRAPFFVDDITKSESSAFPSLAPDVNLISICGLARKYKKWCAASFWVKGSGRRVKRGRRLVFALEKTLALTIRFSFFKELALVVFFKLSYNDKPHFHFIPLIIHHLW